MEITMNIQPSTSVAAILNQLMENLIAGIEKMTIAVPYCKMAMYWFDCFYSKINESPFRLLKLRNTHETREVTERQRNEGTREIGSKCTDTNKVVAHYRGDRAAVIPRLLRIHTRTEHD